MIRFILNNKPITTDLPPGTVLLDLIRYDQRLTGTKIGCREGDCGACTVLIGELKDDKSHYQSMTSCLLALGNVEGKHVVTIEGINLEELNPIQQAMADEGATQCGFCTPGFVMSLAGFCVSDKEPNHQNAIAAVDGNICRCTGYKSIERAAKRISELMTERDGSDLISFTTTKKILPAYFSNIKSQLQSLENGQLVTRNSQLAAIPLGGGTDLYVQKHDEMTHADLHFMFDTKDLKGIRKDGNKCILGASTTVTDLKESSIINEYFPQFQRYAKLVSSTPIRNMATVAGNFINASPIGDLTIFFLALDAELFLSPLSIGEGSGARFIPLRNLFKGYKSLDKTQEEYIHQISFELPGKNDLFHFEKVSKRMHLDIATVNSAIRLTMSGNKIDRAIISAGGVGPIPMVLKKASEFLKGKEISVAVVDKTIEIARSEISPISDARGSKEYKTLLLGQLIKAHFITLFPGLENK